MSLTISNQATATYDLYNLTNSSTYKENEVDAAKISKENYRVADLTRAVSAVSQADSTDFSTVVNAKSYAENVLKASQISTSSSLSSNYVNKNFSGLLSNEASDLYSVLDYSAEAASKYLANLTSKTKTTETNADNGDVHASDSATKTESDKSYLQGSTAGSMIDVLA